MDTAIIFAANLRRARRAAGLTQRVLAERLGYSEKSISKWEAGNGLPPSELLPTLADLLGTRIDELFTDTALPSYYLGVDGGGTKCEFLLTDAAGRRVAGVTLGAANPNDIGMAATRAVLREGIERVAEGIPYRRISAFCGVAGGITGENRERIASFLAGFGFAAVGNGSDAEAAVAAALGDGDGVAVIAGTGSIAFARRAGVLHRFGGFGYLLGDGGSGFAVGRDAILYTLRAEERGSADTPLTVAVRGRSGMPRVLDAVGKLYEGGKREIASYARLVTEAHAAGDEAATRILRENAAAIAELARASDAVFAHDVRRVVLVGGMVAGESPYAEMIREALADDTYCVSVCRVPAVYGALRLAGLKGEELC